MFAAMKPYAPPPPPGAQPPPLWGDEDHVRALLGDRVTDVVASDGRCASTTSPTAEAFREYFKTNYGPTIAVYSSIADDPSGSPPWTPTSPRSPPGTTAARGTR